MLLFGEKLFRPLLKPDLGPEGGDDTGFDFPPPPKDGGAPEPTIEPATTPEPETPDEPAPEEAPVDEDPEIEIPQIGKRKLSEVRELLDKGSDYTKKTQAHADEVRRFAEAQTAFNIQKKLAEDGVAALLRDPKRYEEMRRSAGIVDQPTGPDPVKDPQGWFNQRFNEYRAAGKEVTRETLLGELAVAQNRKLVERVTSFEQDQQRQREEAQQAQEAREVTAALNKLYADPRYALAASDEGKQMVDDLIAAAVQRGQDADLESIVKRVQDYSAKLVASYVGAKRKDGDATRSQQRGAGGHPAPKPVDHGDGMDGFDNIARERGSRGG